MRESPEDPFENRERYGNDELVLVWTNFPAANDRTGNDHRDTPSPSFDPGDLLECHAAGSGGRRGCLLAGERER